MPYINTKVSVALTKEKETILKTRLGKAIELIPGKSESRLMLNFEDNCRLYFKGDNHVPTAFVEVNVYGSSSPNAYNNLTGQICKILYEELCIEPSQTFVKYQECKYWGWNGANF